MVYKRNSGSSGTIGAHERLQKLHPEAIEYGVDTGIMSDIQMRIRETAAKDYEILTRYVQPGKEVQVLWGEKLWIKRGLSQEQIVELQAAIDRNKTVAESFLHEWNVVSNRIIERLISFAQSGKVVLTDMVDIESFENFKKKKGKLPVFSFLTYCPLKILSNRILKRNREAEESGRVANKRVGFPLLQFSQLYRRRKNIQEPLMGVLRKKEVDEAFGLHFPNDPGKKLEFLKALEFEAPDLDQIELTPRFNLNGLSVIHTENSLDEAIDRIETESLLNIPAEIKEGISILPGPRPSHCP